MCLVSVPVAPQGFSEYSWLPLKAPCKSHTICHKYLQHSQQTVFGSLSPPLGGDQAVMADGVTSTLEKVSGWIADIVSISRILPGVSNTQQVPVNGFPLVITCSKSSRGPAAPQGWRAQQCYTSFISSGVVCSRTIQPPPPPKKSTN